MMLHFITDIFCRKHTNKLIILHKLTNYGFAINTIEELDLHRKSKICFIINRSKLINSHRLMALLCLTYEIYDKKFWKAIFKLAINSQSVITIRHLAFLILERSTRIDVKYLPTLLANVCSVKSI